MNHTTDGNLAAIESYLNEQEDDDNSGTLEEHRELAKSLTMESETEELAEWLTMTDDEKAEFYWQHPEAVPDHLAGYALEHWEGFMVKDKEDE
jgi:hypothetical protein